MERKRRKEKGRQGKKFPCLDKGLREGREREGKKFPCLDQGLGENGAPSPSFLL